MRKKFKMSKKARLAKAKVMRKYRAAHPEQVSKQVARARRRRAEAKKKALKQLRSKASAKSQSGQKVSLQQ
jgi:hypothetical protein